MKNLMKTACVTNRYNINRALAIYRHLLGVNIDRATE